jgi:hypothetical protein
MTRMEEQTTFNTDTIEELIDPVDAIIDEEEI